MSELQLLLFGISACVLTGLSWIVSGIIFGGAKRAGLKAEMLLFIHSVFVIIISLIFALCSGFPKSPWKVTLAVLALQFVSGLVNNRQLVDMAKAMETGPNGIIWSIVQCGFVIASLVGIVFYDVEVTVWNYVGFVAIILALNIMGFAKDNKYDATSSVWKRLAFRAFMWTGIQQTLCNIPSYYESANEVNSMWRTVILMIGIGGATPLFMMFNKKDSDAFVTTLKEHIRNPRVWKCISVTIVVGTFAATMLMYPGLDAMAKVKSGAMAMPLMVCSCIIGFDVYGFFALHEKRNLLQMFALLLCLAGAVAICLKM